MREYIFRVEIKTDKQIDEITITRKITDAVYAELESQNFLSISARPLNEEE